MVITHNFASQFWGWVHGREGINTSEESADPFCKRNVSIRGVGLAFPGRELGSRKCKYSGPFVEEFVCVFITITDRPPTL